ncbi:hypothetical protein ACET3Z_003221 [Daucus carota]
MEFEEQPEDADQATHELPHSHPPPSYDSVTLNNNNNNNGSNSAYQARISPLMQLDSPASGRKPCRYRECLKNHAVGLGGHAVDGCCEFMPAGDDGTLDALKCAASPPAFRALLQESFGVPPRGDSDIAAASGAAVELGRRNVVSGAGGEHDQQRRAVEEEAQDEVHAGAEGEDDELGGEAGVADSEGR